MTGLLGVNGRDAAKILKLQNKYFKNTKNNSALDKFLQKYDKRLSLGEISHNPKFISMLKSMLDFNPKSRKEPNQLLEHPFLQGN